MRLLPAPLRGFCRGGVYQGSALLHPGLRSGAASRLKDSFAPHTVDFHMMKRVSEHHENAQVTVSRLSRSVALTPRADEGS